MRVTIKHREEKTGILQNHKQCFVDCRVEFSEEERAIIKERDLYGEGLTVRTSTPLPTQTQFWGTNIMRFVGRILIIAGIILGIAGTNLGFLFFVGVGLEIYGWVRTRSEDKRFESDEQFVTIKQLLSKPAFTIHAWNAGYAKVIEDDIREKLVAMKNLLKDSAQLQARQTFEL